MNQSDGSLQRACLVLMILAGSIASVGCASSAQAATAAGSSLVRSTGTYTGSSGKRSTKGPTKVTPDPARIYGPWPADHPNHEASTIPDPAKTYGPWPADHPNHEASIACTGAAKFSPGCK